MSVFEKIFAANESDLRNPAIWLQDWASGGRRTAAGEDVSPGSATQLSAYFAAMRAISEDVAKLPFGVHRREERGHTLLPDDPVTRLLNSEPNSEMASMAFRETLTAWALGWGDGFAEIEFNGRFEPVALWPIHPSRVQIMRPDGSDPERAQGSRARPFFYRVHASDRQGMATVNFTQGEVLHIHGLGNGLRGFSIAHVAAESIGGALAVQNFGNSFFAEGIAPSGVVTVPGKIPNKKERKELREHWKEAFGGGAAGTIGVLDNGATFSAIAIPPEQAQWIQSKQHNVEEMARWFRIPPHKIQHLLRSTNNNIAAQNVDYVGESIFPWARRWDLEAERKLIRNAQRKAQHDFAILLKADPKTRAEHAFRMFRSGAFSPNDIREGEGKNPVPGGDTHFVERNMIRLEDAVSGLVDQQRQGDAGDQGAGVGGDNTGDQDAVATAPLLPVLQDAVRRCVAREILAAQKAAKRRPDHFAKWAGDFYGRQRAFLDETLRPALGDRLEELGELLDEYVASSRDRLLGAHAENAVSDEVKQWAGERDVSLALAIDERIRSNGR